MYSYRQARFGSPIHQPLGFLPSTINQPVGILLSTITVLSPWCTLPETNIAPENILSQKETSIPTIHFQVLC